MSDRISIPTFWTCMVLLFLAGYTKHLLTLSTGPTVLENDAQEYWSRGERVAQGDWLQAEGAVNYRTPLYPYLIGICCWLFQDQGMFALAVTQHVLQMASSLIVTAICWGITQQRWIALAGYAMSVMCITRPWYANVVLTETLFTFMMTATVGTLVAYLLRPSSLRAAGFGAVLALATLTRPIPKYLWLPLVLLFFFNVASRAECWWRARHVAASAAAMIAVLAPWWIRNSLIFEEASVASIPPINKWVVCFHDQSAADLPIPDTAAGKKLIELLPELEHGREEDRNGYQVIERLQAAGLTDPEVDKLITDVCRDAIIEHPGTFSWKTFKRFVNFWRCSVKEYPFYAEYPNTEIPSTDHPACWRWEPVATSFENVLLRSPSQRLRWMEVDSLLAWLGTVLLIARRRTRVIGLSLTVIFLYFSGVTALLEIENYRYRMVLDPSLTVAIITGLLDWRPRCEVTA